jgi:hypothetical protein
LSSRLHRVPVPAAPRPISTPPSVRITIRVPPLVAPSPSPLRRVDSAAQRRRAAPAPRPPQQPLQRVQAPASASRPVRPSNSPASRLSPRRSSPTPNTSVPRTSLTSPAPVTIAAPPRSHSSVPPIGGERSVAFTRAEQHRTGLEQGWR